MLVYLICYIVSFILAWQHIYVLSGLVLLGAALWLYIKDYMRTGNLIHLRGLFCLFFVGGQGISCFKLSRLQTDWALMTWISLFLAVVFFWTVFEILTRLFDGWSEKDMQSVYRFFSSGESPLQAKRILISMSVITAVSLLAFLFEAWRLGFVPMFSYGVPHAYSEFHISGVHYFTVSCVLVPSLSVVYSVMTARRGRILVSRGTLDPAVLAHLSCTGLSPSLAGFPKTILLGLLITYAVRTPECTHPGLGSSAFARRYSQNRCFFLFLRLLRCFSSPGSLLNVMYWR